MSILPLASLSAGLPGRPDNKPAFQGTLTLTHRSGFYLSTWVSSASANDAATLGGTKIAVFGGHSHSFRDGIAVDSDADDIRRAAGTVLVGSLSASF